MSPSGLAVKTVRCLPRPQFLPHASHDDSSSSSSTRLSQWISTNARPLSDIREMSEPSIADNIMQPSLAAPTIHNSRKTNEHDDRGELRPGKLRATAKREAPRIQSASSCYSDSSLEPPDACLIPPINIPTRSTSHSKGRPEGSKRSQVHDVLNSRPTAQSDRLRSKQVVLYPPQRNESPVREAVLRSSAVTSDHAQDVLSHTNMLHLPPGNLLEFPIVKHPRVKIELELSSPVSVGGASIEGQVKVTIDDNERAKYQRSLDISSLTATLVGFEQVTSSPKCAFIALATGLINTRQPPPKRMVGPRNPLFDDGTYWPLIPSCSTMTFSISLPLDVGPPPFQSKHANIRYMIAVTATIKDAGRSLQVRTSQDVNVLTTHDPEKVLCSLPSPLTAQDDSISSHSGSSELLRLIVGMHRQVWVSGGSIFVDVHIANKCRKPLRRLELSLERDVLRYRHAAASTMERSASHARVFESNDRSVIMTRSFRSGHSGWRGVDCHSSETRTYELEIPRGHGTVRCGKYFEVRYFLNVSAASSSSRKVAVQLPITLIHMGSIDVLPNAAAQVAAALEQEKQRYEIHRQQSLKRSRSTNCTPRQDASGGTDPSLHRHPSTTQGRAFAAARERSLDRQRAHQIEIAEVGDILEATPRKHVASRAHRELAVIADSIRPQIDSYWAGRQRPEERHIPLPSSQLSALPVLQQTDRGHLGTENRVPPRPRRSFDTLRDKISSKINNNSSKGKDQMTIVHHVTPQQNSRVTPHDHDERGEQERARPLNLPERAFTALGIRGKDDHLQHQDRGPRREPSKGVRDRGIVWWDPKKDIHNWI